MAMDLTELIRIELQAVSNLKNVMDRDRAAMTKNQRQLKKLQEMHGHYGKKMQTQIIHRERAIAGTKEGTALWRRETAELGRLQKLQDYSNQKIQTQINYQKSAVSGVKDGATVNKQELAERQKRLKLVQSGINLDQAEQKGLIDSREALGMNLNTLNYVNAEQTRGYTTGGKWVNRIRQMTHSTRGFKMELLSVMFFGMALNRFFTGMLKPALQWTGLLDLMGVTLGIVFLPVAMALLDIMLPIFEYLMALPEPIKLFIGILVVAGAILGGFLMVIGMVGLGVGGLIIAFGSIVATLSAGLPLLGWFAGGFATIAAIIGAVILSTDTANAAFIGMGKEGAKTGSIFDNIYGIISGFVNILPEPIKGLVKGLKPLLKAIQALFKGDFSKLSGIVTGIIGKMIGTVQKTIIDGIIWVFGQLKTLPVIGDVIILFEKVWNAVAGWLMEASQIETLEDAIDFAIRSIQKLGEWGLFLAVGLIQGIVDSWSIVSGMLHQIPIVDELLTLFEKGWNAVMNILHQGSTIEKLEMAFDYIIRGITKFGEWGVYIAKKMVEGIANALAGSAGRALQNAFISRINLVLDPLGVTRRFGGWKQHGGIFTKPTIIGVGEAGPEAVIPLDKVDAMKGIVEELGTVLPKQLAIAFKGLVEPILEYPLELSFDINDAIRETLGFQHGGIVTKPTFGMVGEKGPEAIVPLEKTKEIGATYNFDSTFNISADIASDWDIDDLVKKIDEKLVTQYRRITLG